MGLKGSLIGSLLGGFVGHLPGALIGSYVGHKIEERFFSPRACRPAGGFASGPMPLGEDRAMVFCASAAAMLAKMAKADGRVTADEIAGVERAFARLGFSPGARRYAIGVFRRAKGDAHTIYEYAAEFARIVPSVGVRELFYGLLWDIACADGVVSPAEDEILRSIPKWLRIRFEWYSYHLRERVGGGAPHSAADELEEAYGILGAKASDSDQELKRKYRELAKKNHPDVLRSQGLPEEMVGKATERMSRINNAWNAIKESRGL